MTQDNLANTLSEQASAAPGADRARLLAEAVQAFLSALEVYTRETLPQDWAMTQNNLAHALRNQAAAAAGEDRPRLLAEAVAAKRAALTIFTADNYPDWHRDQLAWISQAEAEIRQLVAAPPTPEPK